MKGMYLSLSFHPNWRYIPGLRVSLGYMSDDPDSNSWCHIVPNTLIPQIIFKCMQFKLSFFPLNSSAKGPLSRERTLVTAYTDKLHQNVSKNRLEYQRASIRQFAKDNNEYICLPHIISLLNFLKHSYCLSGEKERKKLHFQDEA